MNESPQQKVQPRDWVPLVRPFTQPSVVRSVRQILTSYLPFLTLWYLAYRALELHWGLTLLLDLAAAFFLVRIFILQHDAGHGSFFKNPRANDVLG
ncbi:MAG TPA: fatty acid desaturase, partial [Oceanithermus profundus]|nr:fatty acid desaturase [Oceanithermus profundus]